MALYAYGNTVNEAAQLTTGSGVSSLVEDFDDWNLGDIPVSRNADVRANLRVNFKAIQRQRCEVGIAVSDKTCICVWAALQCLDTLQESEKARVRNAALQASGAKQLPKIDWFESHEQ